MTLDLRIYVLSFSTTRQELHQVYMVLQWPALVQAVALRSHQLDENVERLLVVVEQEDIVAHVHQLRV